MKYNKIGMKEAYLYQKLDGQKVKCQLCSHRCVIDEGRRGICSVRENRGGILYSLVYDKVCSVNVDPIEKKPFFHFLPGTQSLSIATVGCNFHCLNCQNYEISQYPREKGDFFGKSIEPSRIVRLAKDYSCASLSFTYTEPTIFFELAYETAMLASREGIKNNFITNGYMTPEALEMINPYLHAANVDLKGFNDRRYKEICGARLKPVLDNIRLMKEMGIWVEVTTLIIPTLNDSEEELREIAKFIKEIDDGIPWHVSAFYPTYKMTHLYRTPPETLHKACSIGKDVGLKYVYTGNIPGDPKEDTYCWSCEKRLIDRWGYHISKNLVKDGRCPYCNEKIDGVW